MYSANCKQECKRGTGWRWISKKQREEFNQCMDECGREYQHLLTGGNQGTDNDKEADQMTNAAIGAVVIFIVIVLIVLIRKNR